MKDHNDQEQVQTEVTDQTLSEFLQSTPPNALSRGVHELSDEECLKLASTIRLVLGELSERLSTILKDEAELTEAVSTLLRHKNN